MPPHRNNFEEQNEHTEMLALKNEWPTHLTHNACIDPNLQSSNAISQFELEQRFEAIPAENNLKQCMFVMQMQHGQ